jgi:NADH-quinone oxidoreductase subunit M
MKYPLLSLILLAPIAGAMLLLIIPERNRILIKVTSVISSILALALSIIVFVKYDKALGGLQFNEHIPWIQKYGINYDLGIDGLSLPMVLLTAIIFSSVVFVSWNIVHRTKEFYFYMLVVIAGVFGVFMARDLFVMFLFVELAVIPKFILINIWGSKDKDYAALKYTLYLFAGSAIALVGIIAIFMYASDPARGYGINSFDIASLANVKYDVTFQKFAFFLMLAGFGVFVPIWPAHRWTPDGHSSAPTAISMILAGVIMKLGGYALIRVGINFFPEGAAFWAPLIAILATVNSVYIALVAMVQKDMKYVVANSSISHMGYVLIGIASLNAASLEGASAQMFAHGIMAALFFALVGNIYDKAHTREITDFGGLAHQMPIVASAFMIAGLASLGMPGSFNFIAEFSVFVGSIQVYPILSVISIFAVVITAIYVLRVIQQIFFGPRNPKWDHLHDAGGIELVPIVLLCGTIILFGVMPGIIINIFDGTIAALVQKFVTLNTAGIF